MAVLCISAVKVYIYMYIYIVVVYLLNNYTVRFQFRRLDGEVPKLTYHTRVKSTRKYQVN